MVCSVDKNANEFIHVVRSLHDNDTVIRLLTMRLISKADNLQLKEAIHRFKRDEPFAETHMQGLAVLLEGVAVVKETIVKMINDDRPLIKRY